MIRAAIMRLLGAVPAEDLRRANDAIGRLHGALVKQAEECRRLRWQIADAEGPVSRAASPTATKWCRCGARFDRARDLTDHLWRCESIGGSR